PDAAGPRPRQAAGGAGAGGDSDLPQHERRDGGGGLHHRAAARTDGRRVQEGRDFAARGGGGDHRRGTALRARDGAGGRLVSTSTPQAPAPEPQAAPSPEVKLADFARERLRSLREGELGVLPIVVGI